MLENKYVEKQVSLHKFIENEFVKSIKEKENKKKNKTACLW